jgi:ketosteroid isomerase-like protein
MPTPRRVIVFLPLVAALLAAPSFAATAEQAVLESERAWAAAVVSRDEQVLNRVLADELSYGHATGALDTKVSYISRIKSGAQNYVSFVFDAGQPAAPRIYGDTAILIASATASSITDGKPNVKHLRYLHVYVKRAGRWQLAAHQSVELHP